MSNKNNETRQLFLLTFFNEDKYEEKEVNGFHLIKSWDANHKKWIVSIYPKESFKTYIKFKKSGGINEDMFRLINKED